MDGNIRPPLVEGRDDLPAQIHLEPVAAPSVLGLYGFAAGTFLVAGNFAGWFGNARTALLLFPFVAMLGGLAQFTAAMWAFKARDSVATAMHGVWGAFGLTYGILAIVLATGVIAPGDLIPSAGYMFLALAMITLIGAFAENGENRALGSVWTVTTIASAAAAVAAWAGSPIWMYIAAYLFIVASFVAWYAGSALMLESAYGHVVFPLGIPPAHAARSHAHGFNEPGVIRGQA